MNFCPDCQRRMEKMPMPSGDIVFECRCKRQIPGGPADTLMSERIVGVRSNMLFDVMIENSSHDLAKNVVRQNCPKCPLDFMTLVRVGADESVIYTCICGARINHREYAAMKTA